MNAMNAITQDHINFETMMSVLTMKPVCNMWVIWENNFYIFLYFVMRVSTNFKCIFIFFKERPFTLL
jgi:hypothetical protein